jgi:hypothetical protein
LALSARHGRAKARSASSPYMSQPSTSCLLAGDHKGVDARDKPGHDEVKQKGPGKTGALCISQSQKTDQRE